MLFVPTWITTIGCQLSVGGCGLDGGDQLVGGPRRDGIDADAGRLELSLRAEHHESPNARRASGVNEWSRSSS